MDINGEHFDDIHRHTGGLEIGGFGLSLRFKHSPPHRRLRNSLSLAP